VAIAGIVLKCLRVLKEVPINGLASTAKNVLGIVTVSKKTINK